MNINLNVLQNLAEAATPGPWATIGVEYGELGAQEIADAAFIAAANPAVVLELVARLNDAVRKLDELRPLTIGGMEGSATLYGTAEQVRSFSEMLHARDEKTRLCTIEECQPEIIDAGPLALGEAIHRSILGEGGSHG